MAVQAKTKNPVYLAIEQGKPFVYFHTLLFNETIVKLAAKSGKSLEIDVSMDKTGAIYIGHPYEFYEFKKMIPPPHNLPFLSLLDEIKKAGLYLVLDCKDVRALPVLREVIYDFGVENVLFHAWTTALQFKPYPPEVEVEPHWIHEDLPFEDLVNLKEATGVPMILSARGLTRKRLDQEPRIIDRVIGLLAGRVESVNFNLPDGEAPSQKDMQKLLDHDLLTWLNVDRVPRADLPETYIGISDHLTLTSDPKAY